MTEVEFHTGLAEPSDLALRMVRKAYRQGVAVCVTASPAILQQLDHALWSAEDRDFVPHLRWPGAKPEVCQRTPIWLCESVPDAPGTPTVLINVGAEAPAAPLALSRLIELVSRDVDAAALGRQRWRNYKALGLEIRHHAPLTRGTGDDVGASEQA